MLRPSSSCCPLSSLPPSLPPSLPSSSSTSNTPDVWSRRSKSSRSQQPSMVTWWASHRRFKVREDMTASSWDLGREGGREGGKGRRQVMVFSLCLSLFLLLVLYTTQRKISVLPPVEAP